MKTDSCPKCDSTDRVQGKVYQQGTLHDIRFKADAAPPLQWKTPVTAVACRNCGYIEFYLSSTIDAPVILESDVSGTPWTDNPGHTTD